MTVKCLHVNGRGLFIIVSPLVLQCLILSTYLIMSVTDDNDGPPLGRRQPPESWEGHSCRAGNLGILWRAGVLGVWAMHRPTSTSTPTQGDAFGMTSRILFRRFFSCCHWCPFSAFSLLSLAATDSSAPLCWHLYWVYGPCVWSVEYVTTYRRCPIWPSGQAL